MSAGLESIAIAIGGTTSPTTSLVFFRAGNISARYLAGMSTRRLAGILARCLISIPTKYLVISKYNRIRDYLFLLYFTK
jgi:hypothetical protein